MLEKAKQYFEEGFKLLHQTHQFEKAVEAFRNAITEAAEVKQGYHLAWANLGIAYAQMRDFPNSIKALKQALIQNPNDLASTMNLGKSYIESGQFDEALATYDKAISLKPGSAAAYYKKGNTLASLAKYQEAIECLNTSLKIVEAIHKDKPTIDMVQVLNDIGAVYYAKEERAKAIECYKQNLNILEKISPEPNHYTAITLSTLANCYQALGDHQEALSFFKRGLDIEKAIDTKQNPFLGMFYYNIGHAYLSVKDLQNAEVYYAQSLEEQKIVLNIPLCSVLAVSFNNLGNIYQAQAVSFKKLGNIDKAQKEFDNAIRCQQMHLEATKVMHGGCLPNLETANALNNLGCVYFFKEDYAHATIFHAQSLEMIQSLLVVPQDVMTRVLTNLGNDYYAQENYDKAIELSPYYIQYHYAKYKALMGAHKEKEAKTCLAHIVKLSCRQDLIKNLEQGDEAYVLDKLKPLSQYIPTTQPHEQKVDNPHSEITFDDIPRIPGTRSSSDSGYLPVGMTDSTPSTMIHRGSDLFDDTPPEDPKIEPAVKMVSDEQLMDLIDNKEWTTVITQLSNAPSLIGKDTIHYAAYIAACENESIQLAKILALLSKEHIASTYTDVMCKIVHNGDIANLQKLLSLGIDVNTIDPDNGLSLLQIACTHQNVQMVRALLSVDGLNLEHRSPIGRDALQIASSNITDKENLELVEAILRKYKESKVPIPQNIWHDVLEQTFAAPSDVEPAWKDFVDKVFPECIELLGGAQATLHDACDWQS